MPTAHLAISHRTVWCGAARRLDTSVGLAWRPSCTRLRALDTTRREQAILNSWMTKIDLRSISGPCLVQLSMLISILSPLTSEKRYHTVSSKYISLQWNIFSFVTVAHITIYDTKDTSYLNHIHYSCLVTLMWKWFSLSSHWYSHQTQRYPRALPVMKNSCCLTAWMLTGFSLLNTESEIAEARIDSGMLLTNFQPWYR